MGFQKIRTGLLGVMEREKREERERIKVGIPEEQGGFTWTGGERGEREDKGWDSRRAGRVYLDWWRERRERG